MIVNICVLSSPYLQKTWPVVLLEQSFWEPVQNLGATWYGLSFESQKIDFKRPMSIGTKFIKIEIKFSGGMDCSVYLERIRLGFCFYLWNRGISFSLKIKNNYLLSIKYVGFLYKKLA